jgi:proton-coupled amino acid transporter
LGFVCAYFVFVAENLRNLVMSVSDCVMQPSLGSLILAQLLLYIPFALVRRIKYFSNAALIADVFILMGLVYIFWYDAVLLQQQGPGDYVNFDGNTFALMIGTALFTFEGIGLVLPISQSMKKPEKFPKVLTITMIISAALFTLIGAICYVTFGSDVQTVVLSNLPQDSKMTRTVQLLYSFSIAFSVPLQLFPAIRILEQGLVPNLDGKKNRLHKWQKNVFRAGLVILMSVVSYGGSSSLDKFVSLIGSFACVPLSFMYPSIFHYKAVATTRWVKMKDLFLFFLGFVMMVYVT